MMIQCYFIIDGEGLMTVGTETNAVKEGDAILIPSNEKHGIKNIGSKI
jgi:mannose-6-phosphate isomerase-like protein (cupin superfamily)